MAVTLTGLGETGRGEALLRQNSSSESNLANLRYSILAGEKGSHMTSIAQVSDMRHPSLQASGKNSGCLFSPALALLVVLKDGTNRSGS